MIPNVRYAKTTDGVHIAYQDISEGPIDVVWPRYGYSNIEYAWRIPNVGGFLRKIGSLGRLIFLDTRGRGLSDRIGGGQLATFEGQMGRSSLELASTTPQRSDVELSDDRGVVAG